MINSNISYLRLLILFFILLISVIELSACQPTSETPAAKQIIVVPDNHPQHSNYPNDISSAVNSAPPGSRIQITEGTYVVDNPVILDTRDIKLYGSGADNTIVLAKNANQPIFLLKADGIIIEAITINALVDDGPDRASFAIQIQEGKKNCTISQTKILNTAASSIIGHSASGCSLIDNVILNAGDDAVRLRGDRLTVIDNTIIQYFDEALDLAVGSDIVVTGNYISNGRIGIVVADCKNALVSHNYVENQILEGIVTDTDPEATIISNIVNNAGNIAYNLQTSKLIAYNQAHGTNKIGFKLADMSKGFMFRNSALGSEKSFVFKNANNEIVLPNKNVKRDNTSRTIAGISKDITFYDNCEQVLIENSDYSCRQHDKNFYPTRKITDHTIGSDQSIYVFSPPVKVEGITPSDQKRADKVIELLKYYNPGFLSIQMDGALMKSEITTDFYNALKGAGELGIGLVRAPFLQFSKGKRSFFWNLSVDGKDVAVISSIHDGPKVRISFLNNNSELSFVNSVTLLKDKILLKLFK